MVLDLHPFYPHLLQLVREHVLGSCGGLYGKFIPFHLAVSFKEFYLKFSVT